MISASDDNLFRHGYIYIRGGEGVLRSGLCYGDEIRRGLVGSAQARDIRGDHGLLLVGAAALPRLQSSRVHGHRDPRGRHKFSAAFF